MLFIVGCAPSTLNVTIRYLPQYNAQPVAGADSVQVEVQADDARSNKADIGTAATALRTWEITTNDNLAQAVKDAVQTELRDRGFKIGPDSAKLMIVLNGLEVERRTGWIFENSAHALWMMQVRVVRKSGTVLYTREAAGEGGDAHIAAALSVGSAERVTNLALQDCIQRLFADPKFIDTLLQAGKP